MGTRLEDAIIKPKSPFPDRLNSNMWSWLTKVSPKKPKPLKYVTIRTEADLDKMLKSEPTVASTPASNKFRNELSALAPVSEKYVYIMMDSGASIHAAWIQKHVPGPFVRRSVGQKNGEFAHTANGERLYNEDRFLASVMASSRVSTLRMCRFIFRLHKPADVLPLGMTCHSTRAVVASAISSLGRQRNYWRWEVHTSSNSS